MSTHGDDDLDAMQRLIDAEAERRRMDRLAGIGVCPRYGAALRVIREALKVSESDAAKALHFSLVNYREIENGRVMFDRWNIVDHLHALLELPSVPRRGSACLCRNAPDGHDPECRVNAMCEGGQ